MMYTTVKPFSGFYDMSTESAREANLQQTGLSIKDFSEISDKDYADWCNPPEGYYQVFDDSGPRVEKIPEPDYVAIAEATREALISEANSATYSLNLKLMMGRKLTEAENTRVNAWLDYIDVLNDTDLSDAPDVQWPAKPA